MDLLNIKPHQITEGLLGKHLLVYGPPSSRKTTFASEFPNTLILATEVGYSFIPGVKAVNIRNWVEFKMAVDQLETQAVRDTYDTVAIDTIGLLSDMALQFILNKHGVDALNKIGWGAGWTEYKNELKSTLNKITRLGYGLVLTAHSKEVYNEKDEIVGASPVLDNSTANIVNALTDFTFFLRKEEVVNETTGAVETSVFAYSGLSEQFVTKSRVRNLNPRIEFTYDNVNKEVIKAITSSGVETTDKVEVVEEKVKPLDELKTELVDLAQKLQSIGQEEFVTERIQQALKGINLNEVSETHREALETVIRVFKDKLK